MSDSGDVTTIEDHTKENCELPSTDKRKHSISPSEPEPKKKRVTEDLEDAGSEEDIDRNTPLPPKTVSATPTPTRRPRKCKMSVEPEATEKPEIEEIEISDDEDSDRKTPSKSGSASANPTPTRRTRTPKVGVETVEAERLRRAEEKRKKDEERENARKAKEEEKRLKEEQKENERRQKEEQKENERKERERVKEEKRLKKEQEEREKEERRKQKIEEEERKKEEKRKQEELKNEKKRQEEEERLKKKKERDERREAERREEEEKKEQKRREDEAFEEKKRRESARFIGFFKPIEKPSLAQSVEDDNLWYKPFQRRPGMVVAPECRRSPVPIDFNLFTAPIEDASYLKSPAVLNRKLVGPRKLELKAKLFQFHDNFRPPYYGTWRKRDKSISFKRPWLRADQGTVDYEVDSDDDWEDEPSDAEECKSDEEDPEEGEDSDDGDGFFVEPDYLSDGEGSDEEGVKDGEAPEARAKRLAGRAREWSENVKRKTETKIKNPVCIGPIFGTTPICEKLDGCVAVFL